MRVRVRRVATRWLHRSIACALLVALLFGVAPVPVFSPRGKDLSKPFPCQDSPCGCATAEECWHHCCCHSNREKVAWAREHYVTPPDFVVAAAAEEEKAEPRSCCHHNGCAKCAAKAAADRDPHDAAEKQVKPASLRLTLVLVDAARRCHNLPQVWSFVAVGLPVRIGPAWSFDQTVVGRVIDAPVLRRGVELSPPVPPPKLSDMLAA